MAGSDALVCVACASDSSALARAASRDANAAPPAPSPAIYPSSFRVRPWERLFGLRGVNTIFKSTASRIPIKLL
jgi:hypothetical protein